MAAFTAIAAGVGLAATAAGTGMSVANMIEQNRLMAKADAAAAKSLEDAKRGLEKNFIASLAIPKLGYEEARRAIGSQFAQAMQAGGEGDQRGLAATAGRIGALGINAQQQVTQQQEKELYELNAATAAEDARLRDIEAQLNLTAAQGAQEASAQAAEQRYQSMASIAGGLGSMASQIGEMAPLFAKTKSAKMVEGAFETAGTDKNISPEQFQTGFTQFLNSDAGKDYRKLFPGGKVASSTWQVPLMLDQYSAFTGYSPTAGKNVMTGNQFTAALSQLSPMELQNVLGAFQSSSFYK
jgi:hypothetical protein